MTPRPPFRADQVGSLLRPAVLREARRRHAEGEITAEQLGAVEDDTIRDVVKMQRAAGLASATDGEFRPPGLQVDGKVRLEEPIFARHFEFLKAHVDAGVTPKLTIPLAQHGLRCR